MKALGGERKKNIQTDKAIIGHDVDGLFLHTPSVTTIVSISTPGLCQSKTEGSVCDYRSNR